MSDEIYRFVDFYELYEVIVNKKLNMRRLTLMNDKNEGLGEILKFQESVISNWTLKNQADVVEFHEKIKGRTYISSWTSEADLMAMWLLYSENCDGIRIKTTRDKLNKKLKNYWNKNYWTNHLESDEGTLQIDSPAIVDDVDYVSFEDVSKSVKKKHKEYYEVLYKDFDDNENYEITPKQEEYLERVVISTRYGALLKDNAFLHEKEVRALFSICLRNNITKDELVELAKKGDTSELFGLATLHYPHYSKLPDIIRIPITHNFVDSLCFDPRMPKYKKEILIEMLSPYIEGIEIEESGAFGYKPEEFNFIID